jgi:probable O-glycosylation ligase (exosortase A-associated)
MKGLLFTYLLAYGGAVAALVNPFWGLLAYIALANLSPEFLWPWAVSPGGGYSRVAGLAVLAGWAIHGFGKWNLGRAKAVILILLAYFAWMLPSAIQAEEQELAWEYVEHFAKLVLPILVGITTMNSVGRLKMLAWVLVVSQAYPAYELNMTYFGGYNQLHEEGFGVMDNNSYGIGLVTATGLACFLTWHDEKWWRKAVGLVSAAFMVHAILFSFSRGGMLGLAIMAVTGFLIMPKRKKEYLAFALALVITLAFAGKDVRERFASTFASKEQRDTSAESRLELWSACCDTMMKYPIFGVGPDHMPLRMDQYGFRKGKEAHTLWLNVGAELGIPALILLMSYYGLCVIRLWPIAVGKRAVADPWLAYLARAVVAGLCGFAVSAQFVALDFLEIPYYVALLGAGVLKLSTGTPPVGNEALGR